MLLNGQQKVHAHSEVFDRLICLEDKLAQIKTDVFLAWIPHNSIIEHNDQADSLAKETAYNQFRRVSLHDAFYETLFIAIPIQYQHFFKKTIIYSSSQHRDLHIPVAVFPCHHSVC